MSIYETKIFSERVALRANFAEASCPIEQLNGDGEWTSTPYQVADFSHRPEQAMRQICEELVRDGGDDPAEYADDIDGAIERMVSRD